MIIVEESAAVVSLSLEELQTLHWVLAAPREEKDYDRDEVKSLTENIRYLIDNLNCHACYIHSPNPE